MPQATWHFRLVKLSGPAGPAAATLRSVRAMQLVSDSQARTALLVTDDCVGRHLQRRADDRPSHAGDDRPSHAGATPPPTSAGPPKGCLRCGSAFRPRCWIWATWTGLSRSTGTCSRCPSWRGATGLPRWWSTRLLVVGEVVAEEREW